MYPTIEEAKKRRIMITRELEAFIKDRIAINKKIELLQKEEKMLIDLAEIRRLYQQDNLLGVNE
jgi:hypothetical protein